MRLGNKFFAFALCSLTELLAPPVFGPVQQPTIQIEEFLEVLRTPSINHSMLAKTSMPKLVKEIDSLVSSYPQLFRKSIYGKVEEHSLIRIDTPAPAKDAPKILLTAGVHGNEHLGTLALLEFLHQYAREPELHTRFQLTVFPMMNPRSIEDGVRRPVEEFDLNRELKAGSPWPESQAFQSAVRGSQFDMALDLHGGPTRTEFFVISEGDDRGLAKKALELFPESLKLDSNDGIFPGRAGTPSDPKRYLMTSRGVVQSSKEGTVKTYLHSQGITPRAYTLEYPLRLDARTTTMNYAALIRSFLLSLQNARPLAN